MERYKKRTVFFAVLAILVICFIFGNSLQGSEQSNAMSGSLCNFLKFILDPEGKIDDRAFHVFIRKAAHFTEFAALGLCLGGFAASLGHWKSRKYISMPLLLSLGTAVTDEFIQQFTGRTSAVKDVLIDFSGAVFGLLIVLLVMALRWKRRR